MWRAGNLVLKLCFVRLIFLVILQKRKIFRRSHLVVSAIGIATFFWCETGEKRFRTEGTAFRWISKSEKVTETKKSEKMFSSIFT